MSTMVATQARSGGMTKDERFVILASSLGTVFEWYDFYLYGSLASIIGAQFFSSYPPATRDIFALLAFAAGFLVRPFGAIVFGRIGDIVGRKYTFLVTILIMGLSTFIVGILPNAETIGFAAPVILIGLRLLQGLALGGEYGGAATYVAEHAPMGKRGYYTSFIQTTATMGLFLSLLVILFTRTIIGEADFAKWGWRVPFLASLVLVLVGLFARYRLTETPEFHQVLDRKDVLRQPTLEVIRRSRRELLLAIGITVSEVGLAYLLTVFVITYATTMLGLSRQVILNAVVYASLFEFLTLPLAGWASDRWGRKPLYMIGALASIVLAFPLFWLLDTRSPVIITATLIVTMTMTHALLFGPKAAFLPELFGTRMRYSGASLGANIAAALSGGFTPLIATALLVWAGASWAISLYLIGLSLLTVIAVLAAPETARLPLKY